MYQFLNCVDRTSKTVLMINNVIIFVNITVMFGAPLVQQEMVIRTSLTKVSASRKSLRAKKHVSIGGKGITPANHKITWQDT